MAMTAQEKRLRDAIRDNKPDLVIAEIKEGADPNNARDRESGNTALMLAAVYGNPEICKTLLDAGARVDDCQISGKTALHFAAREGTYGGICELLTAAGAMLEKKDSNGDTALHFAVIAALREGEDCLKTLLRLGADPRAINNEGNTPQDIAIDNDRPDLAAFLQSEIDKRAIQEEIANAAGMEAVARHREAIAAKATAQARRRSL